MHLSFCIDDGNFCFLKVEKAFNNLVKRLYYKSFGFSTQHT